MHVVSLLVAVLPAWRRAASLGGRPVIEFSRVTVTYPDAARPVLSDVSLQVEEGELCLVAGPTGAGKSTFLGAINGLVPHFTGGRLAGRVLVDGPTRLRTRRVSWPSVVGVVGQDPLAGFVTDTVEEELAYAMEQLAVAPDVMRKRVEETLDLLGIADLRHRPLRTLSGGQQQRVAIGSVLTAHPSVAGARRADVGAGPDGGRGRAGGDHAAGARPRDDGGRRGAPDGAGGAVRRPAAVPAGRRFGAVRAARRRSWRRRRSRPPIAELGRLRGLVAVAAVGPGRPAGRGAAALSASEIVGGRVVPSR